MQKNFDIKTHHNDEDEYDDQLEMEIDSNRIEYEFEENVNVLDGNPHINKFMD